MKQIRRGVFETNSSSTHSISITKSSLERNSMRIDSDGYIHATFSEFGWDVEDYYSQYNKLSYLLTMAMHKEGFYFAYGSQEEIEKGIGEFVKTESFIKISAEIASYCNCCGIWIDYSTGYIDHQSHEDYGSIDNFLGDYGLNIIEFVFDSGVAVHTDNDNH